MRESVSWVTSWALAPVSRRDTRRSARSDSPSAPATPRSSRYARSLRAFARRRRKDRFYLVNESISRYGEASPANTSARSPSRASPSR